jgi:hypothetical protein
MTAGTWRSEQDQVHCAVQDRRPAARQRDDADREGETVSRASSLLALFPDSIIDTISATSMTVTEIARISVPNGSPTRPCATISAR